MTNVSNRSLSRTRKHLLLQGGAMLILLAAATPAAAGPSISSQNNHGDTSIQQDNVDGTVTVSTDAGNEKVDIGQIATPYPPAANSFATALDVRNSGPGTTSVHVGPITGTGSGAGGLRGIFTDAQSGATDVTSTGILNARGTPAVFLRSTSGALAFTGQDIRTAGDTAIGVLLNSTSGAVTVDQGSVSTQGNQADGIRAGTSGAIDIKSGSITAAGSNLWGISVTSSGAATRVTSGTIAATGANDYGIYAEGNTVNVASRSVNATLYGIYTVARGDIAIDSGSITLNGVGTAATVALNAATTGNVTIHSGTIAATGTTDTSGIFGQSFGGGNIDITSGSVTTVGNGGYGILGLGNGATVHVASDSVATTGGARTASNGQPRYSDGIWAVSKNAAIDITSNNVTTSGAQAAGIAVEAGSKVVSFALNTPAVAAPVTIASTSVATTGAGSTGILVAADGPVAVTSGTVTAANGNGIDVRTGGDVTIDSGTVTATGTGRSAIIGSSSAGGNVTINADSTTGGLRGIFTSFSGGVTRINSNFATASGLNTPNAIIGQGSTVIVDSKTATLTGNGSQGAAIFVQSGAGGATITSGTASTQGFGQVGIQLYSDTGGSIDSGTVTTAGNYARAIYSNATGANVVKSATITTSGDNATGIYVSPSPLVNNGPASGSTSVTSKSITTTGAGAVGIMVSPTTPTGQGNAGVLTGATSIASDTIATSGAGSTGISVGGTTGAITVASNTITTLGAGAGGIRVQTTAAPVAIQSGSVTTSGGGAQGIFAQTSDGAISIDAGTTITNATGFDSTTNGTSDAVFGLATGAGSVTVTSGSASTKGDYANAVGAVGGGAVSITSGTASTSGIQVASVYGNSRNSDLTIHATTTTATGQNAYAVEGHAANGNLTITSGSASAALGDAIFAVAGGNATVNATSAAGGGDGGAGVAVTGGTGVTLNIGSASSTGTASTDGTTIFRADAILALATNGAITANIGSASALGAGADAVRLIADGTGGAVTANITGTVSSAHGNGLFIDPPGAVNVGIPAGASVSGESAGLSLTAGGPIAIVNMGTIAGTGAGAAGIVASGQTSLDNKGTISGASGTAVQLGATDDAVILRIGSSIAGVIAGGGGTDTATLIGTGTAPAASQSVASFAGFTGLTVASGYWTASAAPSSFANVAVASGASLELQSVAGGSALTIQGGTIADAGTLAVRTAAGTTSSLGATQLSGSGLFDVTGAGTLAVATDQGAFSGNTRVDGGNLLLTGTIGKVETAAAGTFTLGNGGASGNVTGNVVDNGVFVFNRSDNYTLAGGFSGAGLLTKQGAGTLTFGGAYSFTGTTNVAAGSLRFAGGLAANSKLDLAGGGKLDLSGQSNTTTELSGANPASSVDITGGSLTDNQATDTLYAGSITGAGGSFTKSGAGNLNLTGASTYTGPTNVTGGTLSVNGSLASAVTASNGGKLGGNGSVGGITAGSGGIVGPGNSIGTLHVTGPVAFGPGSTYQVEVNAAGASDQIVATGAASLTGGTVSVLAQPGTYGRVTGYTILTANGGVSGHFADVTSNMAFLLPFLSYGPSNVVLTLARNDVAFATLATTRNQAAAAGAAQALGVGNPLYTLLVTQSDAGAATAFASLADEVHADVQTALIDENRDIREAMLDRSREQATGIGLWIRGVADWAHSDSQNSLRTNVDRRGAIAGIDGGAAGLRFGAAAGAIGSDVRVRSQGGHAKVDTKLAGVYAGWTGGGLSARAGASWAWHDIDTTRAIAFPGIAGTAASSTKAHSNQLFAEISYRATMGPLAIEPYAGYAHVGTRTRAFAETGPLGVLTFGRDRQDADFATFGVKASGEIALSPSVKLLPLLSAAYQRGWGDLTGSTNASFGAAGSSFTLTGAGLGRNSLLIDAGADLAFGANVRLGAAFVASTSKSWSSTGARATLGIRF